MNLLSGIYGGITGVRNALYNRRWMRVKHLAGPVVSVGNISAGGSGKTPFVLLLGELLKERGIRVDVLSRGYRRRSRGVLLVHPDGNPDDFGDEPLLIARNLQVPVIVGESRYEAGRFAEATFGPQLHLLDDGFQHRELARDFDIVLITPEDMRDQMLPFGRLREPLASLARADAVVLMGDIPDAAIPASGKPIWRARRGIIVNSAPNRPVVFCGIARPKNFVAQLRFAGMTPAAEMFYRDHYRYSRSDIENLLRLKQQAGAEGFVTTEKDVVNLGGYLAELQPLSVAKVKLEIENPANVVDTILRRIGVRNDKGVREFDESRR